MKNETFKQTKLVVGQKVFVLRSMLYGKSIGDVLEATVSKVGRKYFELTEYPNQRYHLEALRQVSSTNYQNVVYLQRQDYLDQQEHTKLSTDLRNAFSFNGKSKYSLEQLRMVAEIIGLTNK